jgi:hypothetical protein
VIRIFSTEAIRRIRSSVGIGSLNPPQRSFMRPRFALAAVVKVLAFEIDARDWTSERIAKNLHFRFRVGLTPSTLRNAR